MLLASLTGGGVFWVDPALGYLSAFWDPHSGTHDDPCGLRKVVDGSDRITMIFSEYMIINKWLEVTVEATSKIGLVSPDVFYFGNAVGETGNSPTDAEITPTDVIGVRNNPHTLVHDPAAIDDVYDFNRDRGIGPTDQIIARNNGSNFQTALELITP